MTHVEFMERVKNVSFQYQEGAIMASEGYNNLVNAMFKVSASLYPDNIEPVLEENELLTFDDKGNRVVIDLMGNILRYL